MSKKVLSPTVAERIVEALSQSLDTGLYVNELARILDVYPNSIMHAVKVLEREGVVSKTKRGNRVYYRLNEKRAVPCNLRRSAGSRSRSIRWVKLFNRRTAISFCASMGSACWNYLPKVYDGFRVGSYWSNGITYGVYYDLTEIERLGSFIAKKIEEDPMFASNDVALCKRRCADLVAYAKRLPSLVKRSDTSDELLRLLTHFHEHYLNLMVFMLVPHSIERYFSAQISCQIKDSVILEQVMEPVYTRDEAVESMLALAAHIKKKGRDARFKKLLTDHTKAFAFTPMLSLADTPFTKEHFEAEVDQIVASIADPAGHLTELVCGQEKREKQLRALLKKIKAPRTLKDQVWLLQEYMYLRTARRTALTKANYYVLPLLAKIAQTLKLSEHDVTMLSFDELKDGLSGELSSADLQGRVERRESGWAVLVQNGEVFKIDGAENVVTAIEKYSIVDASEKEQSQVVQGRTACKGKVTGVVRVVHDFDELDEIGVGDILVTKMTTPEFVPAMNRAAGVITNEGGATCHAAIVSREFGIPCIVGTHNATVVLNDGDTVELDADKGVVRVLALGSVRPKDKIVGVSVFDGNVSGTVRVVRSFSELDTVKQGDIIITPQITPAYLSALYRASGAIIEEDSLTSHARLYAKTLKIPMLVGVPHATEAFTDGDSILLDSEKGYAKKLS